MIRVTVYQTAVTDLKGTSLKSGSPKDYHMRLQAAYVHTVDRQGNPPPVPEKIEIALDRDQPAYAVGEYELQPSAIYVDRNGRLAISPRLTSWTGKPPTDTKTR